MDEKMLEHESAFEREHSRVDDVEDNDLGGDEKGLPKNVAASVHDRHLDCTRGGTDTAPSQKGELAVHRAGPQPSNPQEERSFICLDGVRLRHAALFVTLSTMGCSVLNARDPCHVEGLGVEQVNERGDGNEAIAHPQGAAYLPDGRIVVAFVSQSIEIDPATVPKASDVRVAMIDTRTGERVALCNGSDLDETLNDAGTYAYAPSVSAAPLPVAGEQAIALVSWTEGSAPNAVVKMRFLDSAGCPLASTFSPYGNVALVASLAWSPKENGVLATLHDGRDIYSGLVSDTGPTAFSVVAHGIGVIGSYAANAIAPDGTSMVTWTDDALGIRGAVLESGGTPLVPQSPDESGFDLGFPATHYWHDGAVSVSVTAAAGRFGVCLDASVDGTSPPQAFARTFALDGTPLSAPTLLEPSQGPEQTPIGVFLNERSLGVWQSLSDHGTVARFYDSSFQIPAFNDLSCDEGSFVVSGNAAALYDTQSAIVAGDDLWIFFSGILPSDSRGTAVGAWRASLASLWPGAP